MTTRQERLSRFPDTFKASMKERFGLEYYTREEVANILNITVRTVSVYIKNGLLPAVKVSNYYMIEQENLLAFLKSSTEKKQ